MRLLLGLVVLGFIPACSNSFDNTGSASTSAPSFGGLTSATPGSAVREIILAWSPASDSSGTGITYLIFQTNAGAGAENLGSPDYTTTDPTGFVVSGLQSSNQYWFIVQAQDGTGAVDGNATERTAVAP